MRVRLLFLYIFSTFFVNAVEELRREQKGTKNQIKTTNQKTQQQGRETDALTKHEEPTRTIQTLVQRNTAENNQGRDRQRDTGDSCEG